MTELAPNFWDHHGIFFLIFITLFPRLTLLFSSVAFGGILWWIGFIFAPRFLVAILATMTYWKMNPMLVIISWLVAFTLDIKEKHYVTKRVYVRTVRPRASPQQKTGAETIDADYERLD